MTVQNKQAEALDSNLTTHELGQAMSQLDLSSVPPHKRHKAVMDHLMRIMADAIYDKDKALEVHISRILRNKSFK
jgi:hypothetical protein